MSCFSLYSNANLRWVVSLFHPMLILDELFLSFFQSQYWMSWSFVSIQSQYWMLLSFLSSKSNIGRLDLLFPSKANIGCCYLFFHPKLILDVVPYPIIQNQSWMSWSFVCGQSHYWMPWFVSPHSKPIFNVVIFSLV